MVSPFPIPPLRHLRLHIAGLWQLSFPHSIELTLVWAALCTVLPHVPTLLWLSQAETVTGYCITTGLSLCSGLSGIFLARPPKYCTGQCLGRCLHCRCYTRAALLWAVKTKHC